MKRDTDRERRLKSSSTLWTASSVHDDASVWGRFRVMFYFLIADTWIFVRAHLQDGNVRGRVPIKQIYATSVSPLDLCKNHVAFRSILFRFWAEREMYLFCQRRCSFRCDYTLTCTERTLDWYLNALLFSNEPYIKLSALTRFPILSTVYGDKTFEFDCLYPPTRFTFEDSEIVYTFLIAFQRRWIFYYRRPSSIIYELIKTFV